MNTYFSKPQSDPISDIVLTFWQAERTDVFSCLETILPKGVVEVIFNFESPEFLAIINNQSFTIPKCFIQGFHTQPVRLLLPEKQTFFGAVFYPSVAKHLFQYNIGEYSNCILDLTLLDTSFNTLWHKMAEQKTFDERVKIFSNWLLKNNPDLNDREKAFNTFLTLNSKIHLTVPELAKYFCYSPKQLSRKIFEITGMNTEQTLLYKKYLLAVDLMHYSDLSLTEISYKCNFADQSHFTKTFKSLASLTPKEYKNRKSNIKAHLLENVL